jgi:hypothetical protein
VEKIALVLVVLSCVLYVGVLAVPFLALTMVAKASVAGGLFVAAEGTFWFGALIAGPAVVRRYRSKLWPSSWFQARGLDR